MTVRKARDDFEKLLDRISRYIEVESEKPVDRPRLDEAIERVRMAYDGKRHWDRDLERYTSTPAKKKRHARLQMWNLKGPLSKVMEILDYEPNWPSTFEALRADHEYDSRPDGDAGERLHDLLCDLSKIYRAVSAQRPSSVAGQSAECTRA